MSAAVENITPVAEAVTYELDAHWWAWAWKAIRVFASKDGNRMPLTGVLFTRHTVVAAGKLEERWQATATDSYRLAIASSDKTAKAPILDAPTARFLLADEWGSVDLLAKRIAHRYRPTISRKGAPATVTIDVPAGNPQDDRLITFRWGDAQLTGFAIADRFPNYASLWPADPDPANPPASAPLHLNPDFIADYRKVYGRTYDRPRLRIVQGADAMKPVRIDPLGTPWPLWSLLMPVRES